jgi:hypothetical protein
MKIGILTFHNGINYGGFFQAYCLFFTLKEMGYDVEIINYKNKKHWLNEYKCFLLTKNIPLLLSNICKIKKFKQAQKVFTLTNFSTNIKKINTSKYDIIIIGSDIVWNYELEFLGHDPVYFGYGLKTKKIISYAPSFGNVSIKNDVPDYVSKGLKKFSNISVRDFNSLIIAEKEIGHKPQIVLDPTFIFNTKGKEEENCENEEYVLVYAFSLKKEEIHSIKLFVKKNNLKIISIGYFNKWCDKNIISVGPFEWLGYFRKAKYVLTSTFHGTIFSIKYRKKFAVSCNSQIENKIITILKEINLEGRIINGQDISSILNTIIDYDLVERKLGKMIDESRKYLHDSIL